MARGRVPAAVAAVFVTALLIGCGSNGGAPPQSLPPLTSAPSATATPAPTSSTEVLKESAEQFVRTYIVEYDRAQRTNDYSRLQRLYYSPSCEPCAFDLRVLSEDRRKGRHVEGYQTVLHSIRVSLASNVNAAVDVVVHNKPGGIVDNSNNRVIKKLDETKPVASALYLQRKSTGWLIVNIRSFGEVRE